LICFGGWLEKDVIGDAGCGGMAVLIFFDKSFTYRPMQFMQKDGSLIGSSLHYKERALETRALQPVRNRRYRDAIGPTCLQGRQRSQQLR